MTEQIDVEAIEAALAEREISVSRLLYRAQVAGSTWHRLKRGRTRVARRTTVQSIITAFESLVRDHDEAQRSRQPVAAGEIAA